ncbi:hypothetical protein FKM82_018791, partial [Ascaphus truei]
MPPGLVQSVAEGHMLPLFCAVLVLLLLLSSLCTLCRRRRKRKRRNVCPSGVALVDVSLLRQTQLRSLSKSDTKLHEIQRPRLGEYLSNVEANINASSALKLLSQNG